MSGQRRCDLYSATLRGVEAIAVRVEVVVGTGMPGFSIVGMPDVAIQESRERIKAAIRSCGFSMPTEKIVVNLSPGSLKKNGSGFDVPIALGILIASDQLPLNGLSNTLLVGELSLEGSLRAVKGMLAYEVCARNAGLNMLCPTDSEDLLPLDGLNIRRAARLSDFRQGIFDTGLPDTGVVDTDVPDFSEVGGHELAKRALQIAAAGGHGVLMMGPPGSGKTMLASRVPSILPPLSEDEVIETAQIYSVLGEDTSALCAGIRPFRSPHHSTSLPGLVGGSSPVRPGEISLAHNGVLFLDELAEFKPSTLQAIRQPLEEGRVTIVRADGAYRFPSRFTLIAASNPCPCGYYGDPEVSCSCSYNQIINYQNRIGGPLMDRIDIRLDVWRTDFDSVVHAGGGTSSALLREGVMRAREFRSWRREHTKEDVAQKDLIGGFSVTDEAERLLQAMATAKHLSGRSIVRVIRVARTIADMAQRQPVGVEEVSEALSMRMGEKVE